MAFKVLCFLMLYKDFLIIEIPITIPIEDVKEIFNTGNDLLDRTKVISTSVTFPEAKGRYKKHLWAFKGWQIFHGFLKPNSPFQSSTSLFTQIQKWEGLCTQSESSFDSILFDSWFSSPTHFSLQGGECCYSIQGETGLKSAKGKLCKWLRSGSLINYQ